ncbi:hypothetical protein HDZ31DRAFT_44548 [Schizophyllum fasciatum]
MNVQGASDAVSFLSPAALAALPGTLWRYYVDYLWNYDANSWVAHAAYSMRVMAVLLLLPITILTMLDIASYVIARTLGVIDDTRASTSDKRPAPPIIRVQAASRRNTLDGADSSSADSPYSSASASSSPFPPERSAFPLEDLASPTDASAASSSSSSSPSPSSAPPFPPDLDSPSAHALPTEYPFAEDEDAEGLHLPGYEGNLKLSGYGVFSPAASQPGSPVLSRKGLPGTPDGVRSRQLGDEDGLVFRGKKRAQEGSEGVAL